MGTQKVNLNLFMDDELDQSQLEMDFFAPVGNIFLAPEINYITAQSFIPTKNVLTRVEILAGKNSTATYDYTLAIRDDLLESDLTSLSLPPGAFVTENFSWEEFDFEDIPVTPGSTYYIVCYTYDQVDNWYAWGAQLDDVYPDGSVWFSEDDGASFEEDPDADLTFKTYGWDNTVPEEPFISGPTSGDPGTSYNFEISSTDPDGDDVIYCVDWGDGSGEVCVGPYASGTVAVVSHTWTSSGQYTIRAKTTDIWGADSDYTELIITMPRNRATQNTMFLRLLQHFPRVSQLLRSIFGV